MDQDRARLDEKCDQVSVSKTIHGIWWNNAGTHRMLSTISAVDQNLWDFSPKVFQYLGHLSTKKMYIIIIDLSEIKWP